MNPLNQRKEPTFGEPSDAKLDKIERSAQDAAPVEKTEKAKLAFSVSTKMSDGHAFTRPMTRSSDNAELPTLEEQRVLKEQKAVTNQVNPMKKQGAFVFAPVTEKSEAEMQTQADAPDVAEQRENTPESVMERVIPAAAPAAAKAMVDKVPSKYRRLLIVLLLLLALLLAFFLLKPKTPESVETLQEQGMSLPIEFRPVDEEEAKRAEAQAKAAQEALAQQQAQTQAKQAQQAVTSEQNFANPPATEQGATQVASTSETQTSPVVAVKPVVQEPTKKPETTSSVIHQPETKQPAKNTATTQPKPPVKTEPKAQPKTEPTKGAPVVKAEPVKVPAASSSTKTMTVPKGVSLMQVFRDNNLNIADVNAMSKANGVVSQLKAGEKVTVRLDKNNRVTEMSIGSGGKFIRQANGTYLYK